MSAPLATQGYDCGNSGAALTTLGYECLASGEIVCRKATLVLLSPDRDLVLTSPSRELVLIGECNP